MGGDGLVEGHDHGLRHGPDGRRVVGRLGQRHRRLGEVLVGRRPLSPVLCVHGRSCTLETALRSGQKRPETAGNGKHELLATPGVVLAPPRVLSPALNASKTANFATFEPHVCAQHELRRLVKNPGSGTCALRSRSL